MRTPHLPEGSRHGRPDRPETWSPDVEDQEVRQYRFLLRTASLDALEAAHREALAAISPESRTRVLVAVRDGLVAGQRASADDTRTVAHLLCTGERRTPGAFLLACEASALHELAAAVIVAEASFGLFGAYAAWDGAEPPPREERDDSEFGEAWHARLAGRDIIGPRAYDAWGGA